MKYPQYAVAFAILRKSNGEIQSYAAFRATKLPDRHHRFEIFYELAADAPGEDPLAQMRSLIPEGALVIGEVRPGEAQSGLEQLTSTALPMIEEGELGSHKAFVLQGHEERLEELADAFGIPLADRDAPLEQQAPRLADRVQALWLTCMVSQLKWRDRIEALSAFSLAHEGGEERRRPS